MPVLAKIVEEMDVEQRQSPIVQALMAIDTKLDTILNLFAALDARQHRLEAANQPRTSSCVFCPEGEGSHPSGRCPKYPDPVSRAVQASRLGLCDRCLRKSHDEPCDTSCNHCRKPHNTLLCPIRGFRHTPKHLPQKEENSKKGYSEGVSTSGNKTKQLDELYNAADLISGGIELIRESRDALQILVDKLDKQFDDLNVKDTISHKGPRKPKEISSALNLSVANTDSVGITRYHRDRIDGVSNFSQEQKRKPDDELESESPQ
ncbi:unnamed protein product [Cylicocyclus nassatus]|uniref:Uncharacterized protein n=1 Tax=Cylicocyclus nassatus TaxID=53992 RepID=A0AA36HCJ8_CYLNA|nr:unnamed protein product [Cylicocyclus nassatus]